MEDIHLKSYVEEELSLHSYRSLQVIARNMELPYNVNKKHLVKIIYAKNFCSEEILNDFVRQAKKEFLQARRKKEKKKSRRKKVVQIKKKKTSKTKNQEVKIKKSKRKFRTSATSNIVSSKRSQVNHCKEFTTDRIFQTCPTKTDELHRKETHSLRPFKLTSSSPSTPKILEEQQLCDKREQRPLCSSTTTFSPPPSTNNTTSLQWLDNTPVVIPETNINMLLNKVSVPLYTHSNHSRAVPYSHGPQHDNNMFPCSLGVLEVIHNISYKFLNRNPHLYPVMTTAATHCVNSGPVYAVTSTLHEKGSQQNQTCMDFVQRSPASVFSYNISDMLEDALELISQDRQYCESIDFNIEMQCLLCSWVGKKGFLLNHLWEIHEAEIEKKNGPLWLMTYSVSELLSRDTWSVRVLEHDGLLYVLSVKLERAQHFTHTVSFLSCTAIPKKVSMAIYNKETCEPRRWCGEVKGAPETLPYENNSEGLSLNLSEINLLPEGHNNMHISVFVHIM